MMTLNTDHAGPDHPARSKDCVRVSAQVTYSSRSNASVGARARLGKGAELGRDFTIEKSGDRFIWKKVSGQSASPVKGEGIPDFLDRVKNGVKPEAAKPAAPAAAKSTTPQPQEQEDMSASNPRANTKRRESAARVSSKTRDNGYNWEKAQKLAEAGTVPPKPGYSSYGPHFANFHAWAKAGDTKAMKERLKEYKDRKGGRAKLFRYVELCLQAMQKKSA